MANSEHLAILKQGVEVWNKWREENRERIDLAFEGLQGQDLRKVDLSNAYLAFADLSQADLREANFTRSDLSGGKPAGQCM
jgi:uncharacterized protein YjbI with pentapeptide repeats